MSQLIIEMDSDEDEALLIQLLPRLNGRLVERKPIPHKEQLKDVLERIIQAGGAGESFGNPSEWQREIRSWDRVLDGREE
ncbi:hypothetical protein [Spirosoma endophyticum]|uniref:Uncharacterized protein n=1 Tax=Spirosoma endophyticum TaxID=662367 RepID=A0A1I1VYZ8_9BACT|nr:hypothetical protein [Spirosoma endophyticum]SFD87989.1 hypothetical protein SAMN05216167_10845 [Spirosoma endophyticum]